MPPIPKPKPKPPRNRCVACKGSGKDTKGFVCFVCKGSGVKHE